MVRRLSRKQLRESVQGFESLSRRIEFHKFRITLQLNYPKLIIIVDLVKHNNKIQSNKPGSNSKNKKIILIISILITVIAVSLTFGLNSDSTSSTEIKPDSKFDSTSISDSTSAPVSTTSSEIMDGYIQNLSKTHTVKRTVDHPYFHVYLTPDDDLRLAQGLDYVDGVRVEFDEAVFQQAVDQLKPNDGDNSVVIYPIWTSAAYHEPGFYTYFGGNCDESCITDVSFENATFEYTSSGLTAQILYHSGYDFLTEIDVDKNPELLENYDTIILLHNEYVTKKVFDAISSHPNLLFLFPNALYAEIEVDYETNTMTLIRGHQYPPPEKPANGFDYEIEMEFHKYEYDTECLQWEFIEIENGFHLNCYPDGQLHKLLDILVKMKELI